MLGNTEIEKGIFIVDTLFNMKVYGIEYASIEDYKLRDRLSGGDLYSDVKVFSKCVMDFLDNSYEDMVPRHEYHNFEELVELLESFDDSTYLYTDRNYTSGIIINIYNIV
jgi:hypothetical protein